MPNTHLTALEHKHATLDQKIHAESSRPRPDPARIGELKRLKLRVKEQMIGF